MARMNLPRETATHAEDLPHSFSSHAGSGHPDYCQACGRLHSDELHSRAARELAAEHAGPVFPRETGS